MIEEEEERGHYNHERVRNEGNSNIYEEYVDETL